MQQFRFNAAGALRWKADVTEYAERVREFQVPSLLERFSQLQVQSGPSLSAGKSRVWCSFCREPPRQGSVYTRCWVSKCTQAMVHIMHESVAQNACSARATVGTVAPPL